MGQRKIATLLTLKDKMSNPLIGVSKKVTTVSNEMKKAQKQVTNWQKGMVKGIDKVVKAGLALGAVGGAIAIKLGYDGLKELDQGSAKVKSIAKDSLELKKIQKDLLKYSNKTGIAVNELSDTQYNAISSGVKAAESMEASVLSSKLAIAGFTDSTASLKTLTSTMNVYGLTGVKAMTDISDKMLVTQNLGVTTVADLSENLGNVTPIAKAAGVGVDELLSSVASLTKGGMGTDIAITNLKGVVSEFIKPSVEAQKQAKKLGIDFSTSAIKSKGFAKVMQEIKEKTGGNSDEMAKFFGDVRGLSAALALTSDTGMKDFINTLDEMKNSVGATDEAYKIMTNTIGYKAHTIGNTVKNTFTNMMLTQSGAIGEYLDKINTFFDKNEKSIEKWVASIGEGISSGISFIKNIVEFTKKHEKIISTIFVFTGSLYLAVKAISFAKNALLALNTAGMLLSGTLAVTPLGWVVLGIAAVVSAVYLLYKNIDKIKSKINELKTSKAVIGALVEMLKGFIRGIIENFSRLVSSLKDVWRMIKDVFKQLIEVIASLMPILLPVIGFVTGVFVGAIVLAFSTVLNKVIAVITAIIGIFSGLLTVLSGAIEFIAGAFTGDWDRAWGGIKTMFSGWMQVIKSIWQGIIDFITAPVNAVINLLDSIFKDKIKGIKKLWENLKTFLKNPITGTVNLFKKEKTTKDTKEKTSKGMNKYARGGIASKPSIFGEAGREIAIPLNKNKRSQELLRKANRELGAEGKTIVNNESKPNIILQFNQPIYGFADFKNQVAKALVDIVDTEPNVI